MLNSTQTGQTYSNKSFQPTVCGALSTTYHPSGWQYKATSGKDVTDFSAAIGTSVFKFCIHLHVGKVYSVKEN